SAVLFGRHTSDEQCGSASGKVEPYPDHRVLKVLSNAAISRTSILYILQDADGATAFIQEARRLKPSSTSARSQTLRALMLSAVGKTFSAPGRAFNDVQKVLAELDELQHWDPDNRLWQHDRAIAQTLLSMEIEACVSETKSKAEECYSMPSIEEAE